MDHLDPVDIRNAAPSSAKAQAKDPVCGMDVNPATARYKTPYHGKEYFFCCAGCLQKFQANPEKILSTPPKPMTMGWGLCPSAVGLLLPKLVGPTRARRGRARTPVAPRPRLLLLRWQAGPQKIRGPMFVRCAPRCGKLGRAPVPSVEWRSISSRQLSLRPRSSTPAPCMRRSCEPSQGLAQFAAWLWSRAR